MDAAAGPVRTQDRIVTLDVIRAFALLGILIMNMPGFGHSFFAEADGSHLFNDWWDRGAETLRNMLFAGKFNSMFSMLFAIGFTIQLERLEAREPGRALSIYVRRILVLLGFGVIHACVIWTGDVLHVYAVLGLLLILLRRVPDRAIFALIALSVLYTPVIQIIRIYLFTPEISAQLVATAKMWEASNNLAYGHGSFLAAAAEHTREMTFAYTDFMQLSFFLGFYVLMFTTVLMGLVIGRRRWIQRAAEYAPLLPKIQVWTLGVGLGCAAVFGIGMQFTKPMEPSALKILTGTCFVVARICLMLFYVVTIVRLSLVPKWQQRFAGMALVGRMPLTNYISQSLICTAIFYGWGFGLWGRVGPALQLLLAFAVFFLIQVPFSRFWLGRFHYGPLEYLWRILTYGIGASGTFRIRPPVVAAAQA